MKILKVLTEQRYSDGYYTKYKLMKVRVYRHPAYKELYVIGRWCEGHLLDTHPCVKVDVPDEGSVAILALGMDLKQAFSDILSHRWKGSHV